MEIDGKELSEETIKKACEAYGISFEAKEFEPIDIHGGCFEVGVDGSTVRISTGSNFLRNCFQNPDATHKFIAALQSAIDFVESK